MWTWQATDKNICITYQRIPSTEQGTGQSLSKIEREQD